MTELEKIELNCRRLIACTDRSKMSDILKESVGYIGLAKAFVALSDEFRNYKAEKEAVDL